MSVQDEGNVPFEKLPLAELKNWMEDWMDLPTQGILNFIGGGGGGGGTTIINGDFRPGVPYWPVGNPVESLWVPDWGPLTDGSAASGVSMANIGNQGWAVWTWSKFVCRKDRTVNEFRQFWQVSSSSLGANNTVATGIYNSDGTQLLAETGFLHLNSDLGLTVTSASSEWDVVSIPFDAGAALEEGFMYMLVQVYHASMTNAQFRSVLSQPFAAAQYGLIQANGGTITDYEDQLTYGLSGQFVTNPDPTSLPDDLQAEAANISGSPNVGSADTPWGYLTS